MSEVDQDLSLVKLLWFIKGGKLLVRRNGIDTVSISSNGVDPEINLLDMDSIIGLIPPMSPILMERMRRLSKKMAGSAMNVRINVDGGLFLNMGSKGSTLKDLEGFASVLMKRLSRIQGDRKRK